jgi:hypothetical protein
LPSYGTDDNFTPHDIDTSKMQVLRPMYQKELYKDLYRRKDIIIWMWIGIVLTTALTLYSLGIIAVLLVKAFLQILMKGTM